MAYLEEFRVYGACVVQETRVRVPEIAGGSVSSPTIGVATPLAGAPAHARVIILPLRGCSSPPKRQKQLSVHENRPID